jgi:hypothetical protein
LKTTQSPLRALQLVSLSLRTATHEDDYTEPGQSHNKRYYKKRSKFANIVSRPAKTGTSSQAAAPTVNVQVNQTYNFIQPHLKVNAEFPSLRTLNDVTLTALLLR